jgi:hypothetical protein
MRDLAAAIAPASPAFPLSCAASVFGMWDGGNQWPGYPSWLSFFRHIAKLDLDYSKWQHYEAAAIHGGPRVMHADFCIVSDRPTVLKVDEQNRPHCDDGPFCAWADGTALWAWHGVRVPAWIIAYPERLTVERIQQEPNAEVRRVMLERYGLDRYVRDSGAVQVHADSFGVLYRTEFPDDEPLVVVSVKNSTPESDGSFKDYVLRVQPECRPMLATGEFGDAQPLTARNAIASTFGLRGDQYVPSIET